MANESSRFAIEAQCFDPSPPSRLKRKQNLISAQALASSVRPVGSFSDPRARRSFGISSVSVIGRRVEVTERILHRRPFANLIEFSGAVTIPHPILVVAPLSGSFPILLRDLVVDLLGHGKAVAVADWFDVRYVPREAGRFGLEEQILYVTEMIRVLGAGVHVIGVCQAVVPVLAATAFLAAVEPAKAPCSLVLVGGPVDPSANPTGVGRYLRAHSLKRFENKLMNVVPPGWPGQGRSIYPKAIQLLSFNGYVARHLARGGELRRKILVDDGEDPIHYPFSALTLTMMDLPAEFVLDTIRCVFQDQDLVRGNLHLGGGKIDLHAISRTALMTIEAAQDDIAAPGQTHAAHAFCKSIPDSRRRHLLVPDCGHFSLFHGRTCRARIVPEIIGFTQSAESC
jgi:poly(3-hydroxybutyrate) depolymerase